MKSPIFDRVDYKAISQVQTAHPHSTGKKRVRGAESAPVFGPGVKAPQCLFQIFTWMCVPLMKLTITEICKSLHSTVTSGVGLRGT